MLKELIEHLIRQLVVDKDAISITDESEPDKIIFRIQVAPDDIKRVIGREGRVIKSLRGVARSVDGDDQRDIIIDVIQ